MGKRLKLQPGNPLEQLITNYLICKESVTIRVRKVASRRKQIAVHHEESWRNYIMTEGANG